MHRAIVSASGRGRSAARGLRLALWAALAAALIAASPPVSAQGVEKGTYGDWKMRCETPAGASGEQCFLIQNVAAEDRPHLTLLVIALKTADARAKLLRIVAPLGVLLPAGLGLKIDSTDVGRAGFVHCLATGCVAEVTLEDNLLNQMRGGKQATFIVYQTVEEGIGIPVSLNGFGAGFDALP